MDRENINLGIGLGVFFLGVGLLIFAFYLAYQAFTDPNILGGFARFVRMPAEAQITNAAIYILAALLLWVMGSVGGRIAKHGLNMYMSRKEE